MSIKFYQSKIYKTCITTKKKKFKKNQTFEFNIKSTIEESTIRTTHSNSFSFDKKRKTKLNFVFANLKLVPIKNTPRKKLRKKFARIVIIQREKKITKQFIVISIG